MHLTRLSDHFDSNRYKYDSGLCSFANGFAQLDTGQDASYFGIWANPKHLTVVTYCEGDVTIAKTADPREFADHIREAKAFYDRAGYGLSGIDPGWPGTINGDLLKRQFEVLGLGDLLH